MSTTQAMVTLEFKRGWACRRYSFIKGEQWETTPAKWEAARKDGFLYLTGGQVPMSYLREVQA